MRVRGRGDKAGNEAGVRGIRSWPGRCGGPPGSRKGPILAYGLQREPSPSDSLILAL